MLFALALVLLTFNPTRLSYYHWLADRFPSVQPLAAMGALGLVLGVGVSWSHLRQRIFRPGVCRPRGRRITAPS